MMHNEPPVKRRLVDVDGHSRVGEAVSHAQSAQQQAHAQAARQRFLQTLNEFASDSDSDDADDDASVNQTIPHVPSVAMNGSSIFNAAEADLFGEGGHGGGDGETPTSRHVVSTQVGRDLLQQMFVEQQSQTQPSASHPQPQQQQQKRCETEIGTTSLSAAGAGGMPRVVETYVPLSTGGFLDSTDESINLKHLKVGAILYVKPSFAPTSSPTGSAPSPMSRSYNASPTTASPTTTTTAPTGTAVKMPAHGLDRFRKHSELTAEEKLYGKVLTPDMADHLVEVSRVDLAAQVVEGISLDGTRRKLRALELRAAGFVEQQLFRKWKADPSSRPVQRVVASPPPPPSSHANAATATAEAAAAPSASAPPAVWWVLPNLIVRVVVEAAGERWFGQKCAVESIKPKEHKVRLRAVEEVGGGKLVMSTDPTDVLEVIGLEGVETVVPKKGAQAIVVAGAHRGDIVTVRSRIRDGESGELKEVEVSLTTGGGNAGDEPKVFRLSPNELCEMRRA